MNFGRLSEVLWLDLRHELRRPMFWIQVVILLFLAQQMSTGNASIQSGDARVGGTKAWITSEFAVTQILVVLFSILYVFFVSVMAGTVVLKDEELGVGEVLRSTKLTPAEYVWGKFGSVIFAFVVLLGIHLAGTILFNHALPHGKNADSIGPLVLGNYLWPSLVFFLPNLILFAGVCFAVGTLSRQPVLVFGLPIFVLISGLAFFWQWSPEWLPLWVNRLLQFVDLSGLRWLNENYLNVDRGAAYYNAGHVRLDALMLAQRALAILIGLGSVALVVARFEARYRAVAPRKARRTTAAELAAVTTALQTPEGEPVRLLGMRTAEPGFFAAVWEVARNEFKLLGRHPGLYLFVPLILTQVFGGVISTGAFDTPLLQTSGTMAVSTMNTLSLLVCMIILFYTTESLTRELATGAAPIVYGTPVRASAFLLGKALANSLLGAAILLFAMLGCAVVIAIQGKVGFSVGPFALVWGLLLLPTFFFWSAFVAATFAFTGNRFATYGIGLAAFAVTGWFQSRGKMTWAFNWSLWSATRWSDISVFELDRLPLFLNRIMVLGAAAFLVVLTLRLFGRRERDTSRTVDRLQPSRLWKTALGFTPWAAVPVAACVTLAILVHNGWEGGAREKKAKDYWAKNELTYRNVPLPSISNVELALTFDPGKRGVASKGTYRLVNRTDAPLRSLPLSSGFEWKKVKWTKNGEEAKPEDRAGLNVFHFDPPLAVGDSVTIGWDYAATVPEGISKNGAGIMEFVVPSSIVVTGFSSANIAPYLGYQPEVGVKPEENRADPKEFPDDFYVGVTPAGLRMAESWYNSHITVDVPKDLMVEATGECVSDVTKGGRRITEWRTDHPVRIFNVIAGRWKEKRADGVLLAYDPRHSYNVDEMVSAMEGARRWYGEWFAPFPWKELRISEFASLATYAQAPPGNISFSEGIGFLTRSKPEANTAFWVTAHECAHQWWPNIAMSGDGPGGDVLSEGMAHFSTILLAEQVKGVEQRMAFCKQIENRYGNLRRADAERPLVKLNGELPGDQNIVYDKGGWALWMLFRSMGRENGLAANRDYLERYRDSRDHPVLQDYLAVLREHAPDTTAFDAFAKQWFYEVVVPEYEIEKAVASKNGDGWDVQAKVKNVGTSTMPVEVAATVGERFPHGNTKAAAYKDARATVTLAAGESKDVTIRCAFKPEKLVVDPDVLVLQLKRKKATTKIEESKSVGRGKDAPAAARPGGADAQTGT